MSKIVQILSTFFVLTASVMAFAYAEKPEVSKSQDCDQGTAMDSYECFDNQLRNSEKEMNDLTKILSEDFKSNSGDEADVEIRGRLVSAQDGWLKYRDNQCSSNYFSKAAIHAPSQSLEITICKLKKTKDRLVEIRETYSKGK